MRTPLLPACTALLTIVGCSGGAERPATSSDASALKPDGGLADASALDADATADAADCVPGSSGEPTELRCTGLYSDWASKTVAADAVEYDPGLHLWSDGAVKRRWISLPPGPDGGVSPIDTSVMDEWTFPTGTKIWKEFALGGVRIETRLLWKMSASYWYATTYRWSADGASSATELTSGELNATDAGYEVPSQTACQTCHQGRLDFVLGFEAVSLSSPGASIRPASIHDANGTAIDTLVAQGWLSNPPATPIVIPGTPTEVAALGYLHSNCGISCHNAGGGLAAETGFRMRLDVGTLASVQTTDTVMTGWNVPTKNFALVPTRIASCSTASSAVYYRMSHRDPANDASVKTQMPPIDTHVADDQGLAIVAAWINEGCADSSQ